MSTEALNLRRRGGYEVWYLTWNHPGTGQGFWLRHVIEAGHSELWFARFDPRDPTRTFGVHRRFPTEPTTGDTLPFRLVLGDAELRHDQARGSLAAAGHDIRWDLRWTPAARALRQLPDLMYARGGLGDTTVQTPNPRVPLHGELVIDGEHLAFSDAPLGQTHLWGKKHAYAWTWAHCGAFDDGDGAVLELLGARLQRGGVTLPTLTLVAMELDGEPLRLNQFRHVLGNRAGWELGRVAFSAHDATTRVTGELTCSPEQMIEAPYVDPDGTRLYCANTEIGDARLVISRRTWRGWRTERLLTARGTAHFEIGRRERDPRVTKTHTLVE